MLFLALSSTKADVKFKFNIVISLLSLRDVQAMSKINIENSICNPDHKIYFREIVNVYAACGL
jgi:hypothetical protein